MGTAHGLIKRIDEQVLGQALKAIAERAAHKNARPMHKPARIIRTHPPLPQGAPRPRPLAYWRRLEEKATRRRVIMQRIDTISARMSDLVRQPMYWPATIRKVLEGNR